jgi:hypothetical protein
MIKLTSFNQLVVISSALSLVSGSTSLFGVIFRLFTFADEFETFIFTLLDSQITSSSASIICANISFSQSIRLVTSFSYTHSSLLIVFESLFQFTIILT